MVDRKSFSKGKLSEMRYEMQEWIQRIAVYVVLITILRSLVGKPQYQQYFRFVSGLVLILLLISPVLRILDGDMDLYGILNRHLYQQDCEEIEASLHLAEGKMKDMIATEYESLIRSQVGELARQHQLTTQEIAVSLDAQDQIVKLEIHLSSQQETPAKSVLHAFRKDIEQYYQLGEESVVIWI